MLLCQCGYTATVANVRSWRLTAQHLGDIETGILLSEEFPCTDDTIGRIDQSAVHVEQTIETLGLAVIRRVNRD